MRVGSHRTLLFVHHCRPLGASRRSRARRYARLNRWPGRSADLGRATITDEIGLIGRGVLLSHARKPVSYRGGTESTHSPVCKGNGSRERHGSPLMTKKGMGLGSSGLRGCAIERCILVFDEPVRGFLVAGLFHRRSVTLRLRHRVHLVSDSVLQSTPRFRGCSRLSETALQNACR